MGYEGVGYGRFHADSPSRPRRRPIKLKRFYLKFPADAYALGPVDAKNEKDARRIAREGDGCKRLPVGFQCWEATPCR